MVSQRTVLTALIYFSLIVFVSIWLMTKNFPDKICDCSACVNANELKRTLAEKTTISSETGLLYFYLFKMDCKVCLYEN